MPPTALAQLWPTNVALHKMSAAVEMRAYDDALKQARTIKLPTSLATSRRAHFLIDRARTEMEMSTTSDSARPASPWPGS